MQNALSQFRKNIQRARKQGDAALIVEKVTPQIDISDLLRSQYVLAVSALDRFVHELVRIGMSEVADGKRTGTDHYNNFQIPLSSIRSLQAGVSFAQVVSEIVQEKHSWMSFQHPKNIADALRLIYSGKLWENVAQELNTDVKNLTDTLKLLVDRRNKIAHEADMDPANPGFLWPIDPIITKDAIDFIEKIGEAIYIIVH